MTRAPPSADLAVFEAVERHLARGALMMARHALLPVLDRRGKQGEAACRLAAALMRAEAAATVPAPPDALATALDRLLALVERQDAQIRALQAMVQGSL